MSNFYEKALIETQTFTGCVSKAIRTSLDALKLLILLEPPVGFEPTTFRLRNLIINSAMFISVTLSSYFSDF